MFHWLKKLISILFVLAVVAIILNFNIGGRPARQYAQEVWKSPVVQKIYGTLRDRVVALVNKDISVEDVFKAELPKKGDATEAPTPSVSSASTSQETKVIHLEKLNDQDRKALEQLLKKASK